MHAAIHGLAHQKKSYLRGRIEHIEKQLSQIPAKIEVLKAETWTPDIVVPMHDVAVDPSAIKGTCQKADAIFALRINDQENLRALQNR